MFATEYKRLHATSDSGKGGEGLTRGLHLAFSGMVDPVNNFPKPFLIFIFLNADINWMFAVEYKRLH
jgi:hypothetical protein